VAVITPPSIPYCISGIHTQIRESLAITIDEASVVFVILILEIGFLYVSEHFNSDKRQSGVERVNLLKRV